MDLLFAKALDQLQRAAASRHRLRQHGDQHLADPTAACPRHNRVVLGAERNDRFIRLDDAAQRLPFRIDHSPAQLGAQHPGGSVRAQAELALGLERRNAIGMRRHLKSGPDSWSAEAYWHA